VTTSTITHQTVGKWPYGTASIYNRRTALDECASESVLLALLPHRHALSFCGCGKGDIRGIVFTIDSDRSRSVVTGATVTLSGPSLSIQTVTDQRGSYNFTTIAPGPYRIEVKAPGLRGSSSVTIVAGTALDVQIQLKVEGVKESVTVKGGDEPAISKESSDQTVINRSTVLNAPNKYDRFESLLPLIPGVVRGPDGASSP
jgi:Carboxypeptidase regulatory-like domain